MCVGLSAKVVKISNGTAVVDAGGAKREVSSKLLENLEPGDYVMVHAGVAIAKITDEDESETDQLMEELLLGPSDSSLLSALPKDSVLLSVYTQDGLCSVSFAEGFLTADGLSYEQARLAVYSIVNSLTGLSTVDTVQILIEGKIVLQICGVDISHPLTKNIRLAGVPTA